MLRPRIRIILPTTSTQPSILTHHAASPSPLHPLSPLRPLKSPLKSPAFFHPKTSHSYNHPLSPITSPSCYPAPQPQSPLAWTWRCHLCSTTYRLGTTRRCLVDGHYFCSNPPPPPRPVSPTPETSSEGSSTVETAEKIAPPLLLAERGAYQACNVGEAGEPGAKKPKRKAKGRRCRRRAQQSCTSSFDYLGWADWNAWRRELSPVLDAVGPGDMRPGDMRLVALRSIEKHQKDCFFDCDFPSECSWQRTVAYMESVMEESPVVLF